MFGVDLSAPEFWWQNTPTLSARLLSPVGSFYGWMTSLRMSRAPSGNAKLPVVCVGNLVMGGAGKTPTTLALLHECRKLGRNPGILLRGYGGTEKGPLRVNQSHHAGQVGDEAILYGNVAPTVISADRIAGATMLAQAGVDLVLMDDGFQNPTLYKDVSLLVVDTHTGWGNGLCFPAGPLRASVGSHFERASAIVVLEDGIWLNEIEDQAKRHNVPLHHGRIVADRLPAEFTKKSFVAFSGIGRPQKFFDTLVNAGIQISEAIPFPDHHVFSEKDAEYLLSRCRSLEAIPITTEKDFARLQAAHEHTFASELRQASKVLRIKIEWKSPNDLADMLQSHVFDCWQGSSQPG